jgi:hypothetical protein
MARGRFKTRTKTVGEAQTLALRLAGAATVAASPDAGEYGSGAENSLSNSQGNTDRHGATPVDGISDDQ